MSKLPAKIQGVVENPKQFISRLKIMHKQKQRLTDFSMNKPQEDLLEVLKTENRIIILKARQMGISTLTRGYHFWKAYTSDQPTQYAVISHTTRTCRACLGSHLVGLVLILLRSKILVRA